MSNSDRVSGDFAPGNRGDCQDCEEQPATHVCTMTINGVPLGPLYVCEECYPDE